MQFELIEMVQVLENASNLQFVPKRLIHGEVSLNLLKL